MDAPGLEQLNRPNQYGQCFEAEEVELHQPRRLDPFHVELGHRHVGFGIAVEGDEFMERPVADHDAGSVGGGVKVRPSSFRAMSNAA